MSVEKKRLKLHASGQTTVKKTYLELDISELLSGIGEHRLNSPGEIFRRNFYLPQIPLGDVVTRHPGFTGEKPDNALTVHVAVSISVETGGMLRLNANLELRGHREWWPELARGLLTSDLSKSRQWMRSNDDWTRPRMYVQEIEIWQAHELAHGTKLVNPRSAEIPRLKLHCVAETVPVLAINQCEVPSHAIPGDSADDVAKKVLKVLNDGNFADFAIRSGSTRIPCHKAVLSARSEVFLKMLDNGLKEAQTGELRLEIIPENRLKGFVDWLYCRIDEAGLVDSLEAAACFLPVADQYLMGVLEAQCQMVMRRDLVPETCLEVANMCTTFGLTATYDYVVEYIACNYDKFMSDKKLLKDLREAKDLEEAVMKHMQNASKALK